MNERTETSDQLSDLVMAHLEKASEELDTAKGLAMQIPLLKKDLKRIGKLLSMLNELIDDLRMG